MMSNLAVYCTHKNTLADINPALDFTIDYSFDERELITTCCKSYIAKSKDAYAAL